MSDEARQMVECIMRDSIELRDVLKEWQCVGVESPKQVITLYYDIIKEILERDKKVIYEKFRKRLFEAMKIYTPLSDEEWSWIVDEENKKLPILYQLTFEERDNLWNEQYKDENSDLILSYKEWASLFKAHGLNNQ